MSNRPSLAHAVAELSWIHSLATAFQKCFGDPRRKSTTWTPPGCWPMGCRGPGPSKPPLIGWRSSLLVTPSDRPRVRLTVRTSEHPSDCASVHSPDRPADCPTVRTSDCPTVHLTCLTRPPWLRHVLRAAGQSGRCTFSLMRRHTEQEKTL